MSVKRTNEAAILPTRATPGSAAIDLYALNSVTLYVGQRVPVDTGIAVAIPEGYAGFLHSRSGHGLKHGVTLANSVGVIDSDYRGPLKAVLVNHGQLPYHVAAGERIAQLVIQAVETPGVTLVDELPETVRGAGGFGSTGVK
nr:dUTP diphosphatase [Micrococcus sp. TA1]